MRSTSTIFKGPEKRDLLTTWMGLVEHYNDPSVIFDQFDKIVMVNDAAVWILGGKEKLIDRNINVLEGSVVDFEEHELRKKKVETEGYYYGLSILRSLEGREYLAELTINRVPSSNGGYCHIYKFAIKLKKSLKDYRDLVKIKNEIYLNLKDINDIAQLEYKLKIDYRRILFLFKKFEGTTPKQYLNEKKIQKCSELIGIGALSFKEIAYELGFCDISHLANVFKEKMNKTLSEYRKVCNQN